MSITYSLLKIDSRTALPDLMLPCIHIGLLDALGVHPSSVQQNKTYTCITVNPNANIFSLLSHQLSFIMAITQFRLFKICTCLASLLSFFKRLICRWAQLHAWHRWKITLILVVLFDRYLVSATLICLYTMIHIFGKLAYRISCPKKREFSHYQLS